jgi:hypothetical protein
MPRIDVCFLLLAAICLLCGVSLGIWMGIAHDFQFAPVHAHINLLGWASLALFGLVYRSYPQLGQSWLALAHFVLAAPTAVAFPVGIYLSIAHEKPAVAIIASLVWFVSVLLFLAGLVRLAIAPAPRYAAAAVPAE